MRTLSTGLLSLFPALALGTSAPSYAASGLTSIWSDNFSGSAGSAPNGNLWNVALNLHNNDEVGTYSTSSGNLQLSGGSTVQLVPVLSNGVWTTSRIESKKSFSANAGGVLHVEAEIRFGTNPTANKQGIWPAFWMLGDSIHSGTSWPACGELDIMETVNGVMNGYGTAHCGTNPGGPCDETNGLSSHIALPDNSWHTWGLTIDRTAASWTSETITWFLDGAAFKTLKGSDVGDQAVWATLAHMPMFIIFDVAVGGDWPGQPNSATLGGYGSMMEVAYVAVYQR